MSKIFEIAPYLGSLIDSVSGTNPTNISNIDFKKVDGLYGVIQKVTGSPHNYATYIQPLTPITIIALIKLNTRGDSNSIIRSYASVGQTGFDFILFNNDFQFRIWNSGISLYKSSVSIKKDKWYCLAVTFGGNIGDDIKMYVDGILTNTHISNREFTSISSAPINLFYSKNGLSIGQSSIYDTVLTDQQIQSETERLLNTLSPSLAKRWTEYDYTTDPPNPVKKVFYETLLDYPVGQDIPAYLYYPISNSGEVKEDLSGKYFQATSACTKRIQDQFNSTDKIRIKYNEIEYDTDINTLTAQSWFNFSGGYVTLTMSLNDTFRYIIINEQ